MFEKNKAIREKAYKCRDANNVKVPVTWEAQRTTKLGGEALKLRFKAAWLLTQGNWTAICFLQGGGGSCPVTAPTPSRASQAGTPAMLSHCPGSSPLESQRGHSQHEQGTVNNNTRFSHILLRLCRNCEQKKAGESYISLLRLENWFQVYQKQQVLQSKWKLN